MGEWGKGERGRGKERRHGGVVSDQTLVRVCPASLWEAGLPLLYAQRVVNNRTEIVTTVMLDSYESGQRCAGGVTRLLRK